MTTPIEDRGYKIEGGNTGVLLIHGLGGTPMEMRYVALGLARAGHTVHVPQLAGHCGTTEDIKNSLWRDWTGSVDKALDELRKTCDTVIVGGLSAGSILALEVAARRPKDVHGIALYAPTLWLNGWSVPWYAPLFRLVHTKWFANLIPFVEREPYGIKDRRLREMVVTALSSGDSSQAGLWCTPGGTMLEFRRLVDLVKPKLKSIIQPALIVHPRDDDRADIDNSFHLQRHLGGPVHMIVLDDSYHIVTVDRQRDVVVERSTEFVSWLQQRAASVAARAERRVAAA
jgi:carboxylesterase